MRSRTSVRIGAEATLVAGILSSDLRVRPVVHNGVQKHYGPGRRTV